MHKNHNTRSYPCQHAKQYASVFALKNTAAYALDMSTLRERLHTELTRLGWTAYDLERESGVPQPTTQRFLNGRHGEPRQSTIAKWAKAIGVTETYLMGLDAGAGSPIQAKDVARTKVVYSAHQRFDLDVLAAVLRRIQAFEAKSDRRFNWRQYAAAIAVVYAAVAADKHASDAEIARIIDEKIKSV